MVSCAIKFCRNYKGKAGINKKISFHCFPNNPVLASRWISVVRKSRKEEYWVPKKSSILCSEHFDVKDIYTSEKGYQKIKKGAVPIKALFVSSVESDGENADSSIEINIDPLHVGISNRSAATLSSESKRTLPVLSLRITCPPEKRRTDNVLKYIRDDNDSSVDTDALSDDGERTASGPSASANQDICCCCLFSDGTASLTGGLGPETYAKMLQECFSITYPEQIIETLTICTTCIKALTDGVKFKRNVLDCQGTMATYQRHDILQVVLKEEAPTETYNITLDENNPVTIKEESIDSDTACIEVPTTNNLITIKMEPVDTETACIDVPTTNTTAQINLPQAQNNFLDKIKEEYDLSCNVDICESQADTESPFVPNILIQSSLFKEQPIDESDIFEKSRQQTPEEEAYFKKGCKCSERCHQKFTHFEIIAYRRECERYQSRTECGTNHMDIFLMGALACAYDGSNTVSNTTFMFKNVVVCKDFFFFAFKLNVDGYNSIIKKIKQHALHQSVWQVLTEQPSAIKFLKTYSIQNSLVLPGRFTNSHPDLHILPKNITCLAIYSQYAKVCFDNKKRCVNQMVWDNLWERFCPYIVHKIPSDLCNTCRENNKQLIETVMNKSLNTEVLKRCYNHLQLVKTEREFYERSMIQSTVQDGTLYFFADFLQLIRLPHKPAAGFVNFLDAYGVALFAVSCQPPGETVVYVVPECIGDDSRNILLSLIHHFIESRRRRDVQWHCGPPLRSECVLQYAAWRGQAGRCRLAFLPPGHDERADCIALLKIALRTTPARTIRELCDVISTTGITPIPVANEVGHLKIPIYNWLAFFEARNPSPLSNLQDYCHFEADSRNIGQIKCKVSVSSKTTDVKSVFGSGYLEGAPEVLPVAGIAAERQKYLYEKVGPHLDEDIKDILCPQEMHDPLEFNIEVKMELEEHLMEEDFDS